MPEGAAFPCTMCVYFCIQGSYQEKEVDFPGVRWLCTTAGSRVVADHTTATAVLEGMHRGVEKRAELSPDKARAILLYLAETGVWLLQLLQQGA